MKLEVKLDGKIMTYHVPQNCDVKLIIRNGKIKDTLEQKRLCASIVEQK